MLQLSRKDVCQRAASSRGAVTPDISWYVGDGSGPRGRHGIYHHDAEPVQFLGSVEKAVFGRHLRGYSQGLLLRSC